MPRLEEFLRAGARVHPRLPAASRRADQHHAEALGISRKSLWERMKRLSIG
jgi:transcriptional regulator with PAS, ATPase and Fis domain